MLIMKVFITVLVLIFSLQSLTKADDIRDFQIEGMSIGDSLLDFYSEKEILNETVMKYPSSDKFYYTSFKYKKDTTSFNNYDWVTIHLKKNDKNYIISSVRGEIDYPDNIKNCHNKKKDIVNEIKSNFSFDNESNYTNNFGGKAGKSISYITAFEISGGVIRIFCSEWDKKNETSKNWLDVLNVSASTKELLDWISNEAMK